MGTGAEAALPKILLGGGLGAAGGALSGSDQNLTSFIGQQGNTGLAGVGDISVDPGDLLAQGIGRNDQLFNALSQRASQPTQLGPASIIQTPAFAFGGALPFSVGQSVVDPGFVQRPGLNVSNFGSPNFGGSDDFDQGEPPFEGPSNPGLPPGLPSDPGGPGDSPFIDPPDSPVPPGGGQVPPDPFGRIPTTLGGATQRGELTNFIDAINMLAIPRGRRPITSGGLG